MKLVLSVCAAAIVLPVALAGPLQRGQVAADPVWVAHVDFERLKQTRVGQFLIAELERPQAQDKFAAFQAIFNFDPRRQLHGLTLYGLGPTPKDGVLLAAGEFDLDRLVTLAKGAKEYQATPHRHYVVHNWIDEKQRPKAQTQPRIYAAAHTSRMLLFGQKPEAVGQALDVLDGIQPNLTGRPLFNEFGALADRAVLLAATRRPELPQSDPNAAVIRESKLISLAMNEADQQLAADLTLTAGTEEAAKQILAIGQGLLALMALQTDKPEATKLAQALAVNQNGLSVVVALRLPAEDAVQLIKQHQAKHPRKP